MNVQGDYGTPIHGVSRQPDSRKFKGQCKEQINMRSNLAKGTESRSGFRHVAFIESDDSRAFNDSTRWELHQRGDGGNWIIAYNEDRPYFFNLDGTQSLFVFNTPEDEAYYRAGGDISRDKMSTFPILDTIFIANTKTDPSLYADVDNDNIELPPNNTWLEFKTFPAGTQIEIGFNGYNYKVDVFNGYVKVNPETGAPDQGQAARTKEYQGSYHASVINTAIPADTWAYNNWLMADPTRSIGIVIKGGSNNIELFNATSIDAIEKLPPFSLPNVKVKVEEGRGDEKNTGYFQAFARDGRTEGDPAICPVAWRETTATGSKGEFNVDYMPHVIKYDPHTDTWTMEAYDWLPRQTGDKDTNPFPSFVTDGFPITSIGMFQNRLLLNSNETVMLSAVGNYDDLWRESAFYTTDADPFEVFADSDELNIIKYSATFDGDLILFSDNGQFTMSGDTIHTYKTGVLEPASKYKADLRAYPVSNGDNILFATSYGNYAGIRELYTDNFTQTKRARPITDHVEDYIEGHLIHMATSTNIDALIAIAENTNTNKRDVFVYEWRWSGDKGEKIQSAWGRWKMPDGIQMEWCGFVESTLYAVVSLSGAVGKYAIWAMEWDRPEEENGVPFNMLLDAKVNHTVTYDSATDTIRIPYPNVYYREGGATVVLGKGSGSEGMRVYPESYDEETEEFVLEGYEWIDGAQVVVGLQFKCTYVLATPIIRDSQDKYMGLDRLTLGTMTFHFNEVGTVACFVKDYRREREMRFTNRRINRPTNRPSFVNVSADSWKDVGIRNIATEVEIRLESLDITPFSINAIEWRGDYHQTGKRMN